MADEGIRTSLDQLVPLLDRDCAAPIAPEMDARRHRKEQAQRGDERAEPDLPRCPREEPFVEEGDRYAAAPQEPDRHEQWQYVEQSRSDRLAPLVGLGLAGGPKPVDHPRQP